MSAYRDHRRSVCGLPRRAPTALAVVVATTSSLRSTAVAAAATGTPPPYVPPTLFEQFLPYLQAIGTGLVIVVVLGTLGFALSRLGGSWRKPGEEDRSVGSPPASEPRARFRLIGAALVVAVAAMVGFMVGRQVAYEQSTGGLLPGLFPILIVMVLTGGPLIVAAIALGFRRGHPSLAIGTVFLSAGFILASAFLGDATGRATGAIYVSPVVLKAAGEAHLDLRDVGPSFASRDHAVAECTSLPDSTIVESISVLELGKLNGAPLRGELGFPGGTESAASAAVNFYLDGAAVPDGATDPTWTGPAVADITGETPSKGVATFSGIPWDDASGKLEPGQSRPPLVGGWPDTFSGSFAWTCDPWP